MSDVTSREAFREGYNFGVAVTQGFSWGDVDEEFDAWVARQAQPAPNHGPLPGGGFWAGFCERCDTLGCPGDCDE